MKKFNKILTTSIALTSLATPVLADDSGPKRGTEIDPIAASCNIGDHGQTSKAGRYNELCDEMSDAEKCFALIKGTLKLENEKYQFINRGDSDKKEFCLDLILDELGSEDSEE